MGLFAEPVMLKTNFCWWGLSIKVFVVAPPCLTITYIKFLFWFVSGGAGISLRFPAAVDGPDGGHVVLQRGVRLIQIDCSQTSGRLAPL